MKLSMRLCCALLAVASATGVLAAEGIAAVDSVGIPVTDLERAEAFYTQVLGFTEVGEREVSGDAYEHLYGVFGLRLQLVRLRLGDEAIELMHVLVPRGRAAPSDSHSNDRWFEHVAIIVSDMDRAYARLRQYHVEYASSAPQRLPDWNPNAAGIRAFYFRDPSGNFLEILQFPPGKGAAKWQRRDGPLFLGIDHTAIVVASTEDSLAYYRDELGLQIAGTSENYGTEQEHLNNVFGAHLRITTLRAAAGPGVELLEYLAPRDGRSSPNDTRANDAWYWQVNMRAESPSAVLAAARERHTPVVSAGLVQLAGGELGFHAGFIVRDPDGHAALIEGMQ
jgi:catechol 2,3-dioxygenase-like lactoylglutathione lyase family enzyme